MADLPTKNEPPDNGKPESLPPWKRKRLERGFEHARKIMAQDDYDFEYATDLLEQCVVGDPASVAYLQAFMENLRRKFKNDRKSVSSLNKVASMAMRTGIKRAMGRSEWDAAIKSALQLLKVNPWDSRTMALLATINETLGNDCHLHWLNYALTSSPNDADINRQAAKAMTKLGQYDQAIACWHRVETARPSDEEAPREIGKLSVEKTRSHATYVEQADAAPAVPGHALPIELGDSLTPEAALLQAIKRAPKDVKKYHDFAQFLLAQDRYRDAAYILQKALEVAPNDVDTRERWEDALQQHLHNQMAEAEQQMNADPSDAKKLEYRRLRKKCAVQELAICKARCERYPTNLILKFNLALRYRMLGDYPKAIEQFQAAHNEPRHKGQCLLNLAQCFQHIKQYRLAMDHFSQAIGEIPDRDVENKKRALYQAGRLALGLKNGKLAKQYVTALASLDFGYKDVAAMLDRVEKLVEEMPDEEGAAASQQPATEDSPPEDREDEDRAVDDRRD